MTLTDGRGELYQWDTGRTLTVDDSTVTQVHFQNRAYGRTIDVDVKDGSAIIPDELLQKAGDLRVYAFSGTAESGFTKVERVFNVVRRNKPNDYMYTPTEQKSLEGLQKQIGDLSELKTDAKTDIVAAINETATAGQTLGLTGATVGQVPAVKAVDENGVPTEWEAVTNSTPFIVEFSGDGSTAYTSSHTFEQIIDAISAGRYVVGHAEELMVSGDPAYARYNIYFDLVDTMDLATFKFVDTGNSYQISIFVYPGGVDLYGSYLSASSSTYGGVKADSAEETDTQPVRIGTDGKLYTAPGSSGGGTDTSLGLTGATVGQTVKIKAVDENGIPTEWEAADAASGGDSAEIDISREPDLILEVSESVVSLSISEINGQPINATEMVVLWEHPGGATYTPNYFRFNNEVKNAVDADAALANFNLPANACPSRTNAAAIFVRVKKINNGTYWYEFSGLQQNAGTLTGYNPTVYGAAYRNILIGETSIKEFYVYQASNIQKGCKVSVWVK